MNIPKIGITGAKLAYTQGVFEGYHASYANDVYVNSVLKAGGLALILPMMDEKYASELISCVDGLLISGGHDLDASFYGEQNHPKAREPLLGRDAFDIALAREARAKNKPIFAICRGLWVLNVAFGGTLYPHFDLTHYDLDTHWQKAAVNTPNHDLILEKDSFLRQILGDDDYRVNSLHSACINKLASSLKIAAKAKDGLIEAVQDEQNPAIFGVQWHPECLNDTKSKKLFKHFINLCQDTQSPFEFKYYL